MRATWYVLEDGTAVDPTQCAPDETGALTHKSGAKIKMRLPDCPMSTGVDLDEVSQAEPKKPAESPAAKTADMKPEPALKPVRKPGYKMRAAKAR